MPDAGLVAGDRVVNKIDKGPTLRGLHSDQRVPDSSKVNKLNRVISFS